MASKQTKISSFLEALFMLYPSDRWSPGLTLSYLGNERLWYGSFFRCKENDPNVRTMQGSVKANSLDLLLKKLSTHLNQMITNERMALRSKSKCVELSHKSLKKGFNLREHKPNPKRAARRAKSPGKGNPRSSGIRKRKRSQKARTS